MVNFKPVLFQKVVAESTHGDINWTRGLDTCLKMWRSKIEKSYPLPPEGPTFSSPLMWMLSRVPCDLV